MKPLKWRCLSRSATKGAHRTAGNSMARLHHAAAVHPLTSGVIGRDHIHFTDILKTKKATIMVELSGRILHAIYVSMYVAAGRGGGWIDDFLMLESGLLLMVEKNTMHHHLGMLCHFVQSEHYLYVYCSPVWSAIKLHILIGWNSRSTNTRELIDDPAMEHFESSPGWERYGSSNDWQMTHWSQACCLWWKKY